MGARAPLKGRNLFLCVWVGCLQEPPERAPRGGVRSRDEGSRATGEKCAVIISSYYFNDVYKSVRTWTRALVPAQISLWPAGGEGRLLGGGWTGNRGLVRAPSWVPVRPGLIESSETFQKLLAGHPCPTQEADRLYQAEFADLDLGAW